MHVPKLAGPVFNLEPQSTSSWLDKLTIRLI
ncbi:hypothetical protein ACVIIV_003119 [Bradyrhizobium sp. USDA 4354]